MKKTRSLITLMSLLLLVVLSACGPLDPAHPKYGGETTSQTAASQTESATNQPSPDEKETAEAPAAASASDTSDEDKYAFIEVKNLSGSSFIMDCDVHPYEVSDAYTISDFTVAHGESMRLTLSAEKYVKNGKMIETSPTTYAIIIDFVLANMPTDKDELAMDQTEGPFEVDEINVTGTYNEPAIFVWDGAKYIKK